MDPRGTNYSPINKKIGVMEQRAMAQCPFGCKRPDDPDRQEDDELTNEHGCCRHLVGFCNGDGNRIAGREGRFFEMREFIPAGIRRVQIGTREEVIQDNDGGDIKRDVPIYREEVSAYRERVSGDKVAPIPKGAELRKIGTATRVYTKAGIADYDKYEAKRIRQEVPS
jgi:hypothetical protein